ncbi:MAG: hypothetical protein KF716_33975 [Anaerolineae bacterium]|nr:hypothetical protein [Anaerolineae bacterium]
MDAVHPNIYEEFADFITSSPTLEEIANYRLSQASERYVSELLEANRTRGLTPEESRAIDDFMRLEHLVRMAKIRAIAKLDQQK